MYRQKAVAVALMLVLIFNILAVLGGEVLKDSFGPEDTEFDFIKENLANQKDFKGTRASSNIDFVSKGLHGGAEGIHVIGDLAYVVAGISLVIFDISDLNNPTIVGHLDVGPSYEIFVEGDFAYIAALWDGLVIVNITIPSDPQLAAAIDSFYRAVDVWVDGSYAYVADNLDDMVVPVNIVDPENPYIEPFSTYFTTGHAESITVSGGFAYVGSFDEGLLILDLSTPGYPQYEGLESTYLEINDVFIEEPYAYAADESSGLVIYDISDKQNPSVISNMETDGHPWHVIVYNSYAYLADLGPGMAVINVGDPGNPGSPTYHNTKGFAYALDIQSDHAFVAAGSYGLRIVDISTPPSFTDNGEWKTGFVAMDVKVWDDYAYIADWSDGLTILDVSDPYNPFPTGYYDIGGLAFGVDVDGSYAYVADYVSYKALNVVDVSDPYNPTGAWTNNQGGGANDVDVFGSFAYLALFEDGLGIVNLDNQTEAGRFSTGGSVNHVQARGGFAYVGDDQGLNIINVSDPIHPTLAGSLNIGQVADIHITGSYAYVIVMSGGIVIIDITDPQNPIEVGSYPSGQGGIFAMGTTVYIGDQDGLVALDTTILSSPQEIGNFDLLVINKITVADNYAYVCSEGIGMYILDISQVADDIPPQVESHIPDIDAVSVFPKSSINITFNENMEHASAESAFSINPTLAGEFSWSGNTMIFSPDGDMQPNTAYTITLTASVQDTAMNTLDGNQNGVAEGSPTDDYSWQFQTSDLPPVVQDVFPENNTDLLPINSVIRVNFSKAMDKSTTQSAFSYTDGINTWTASSGQVTWSNSDMTMEFDPNTNLDYEVTYTFTLEHSAEDTDGMALDGDGDGTGGEGTEDDYVWFFTTSPPSPQVVSNFPVDGAIDLPVDTVIVINFSKSMNQASLPSAFSYTDGNSTWYSSDGIITWSNGDMTCTFTPNNDLMNAVQYWVNISDQVMDADDFFLDGDGDGIGGEGPEDGYGWSFSTIPIPPEVNSTFPLNGATLVNIDTSIIINFSKSMKKEDTLAALGYTDGSSSVSPSGSQVVWSNNNMTLTFTPTTNFANEKTFTFTVLSTAKDEEGAYLDYDGDGMGGEVGEDDFSFSFSTMHLPSKVVQITPNKKETMVEVNTDIVVRFSRSMDNGSVEAAFSYTHENTTTNWEANDGNVQWSPDSKIMTFTPDELLDHDKVYMVTILASAEDTLGVTLDGDKDKLPEGEGIDDYTWEFTTVKEPPEVLSLEPGNNTLDVFLDIEMKIRFDRSMDTRSIEQAFSFTHSGTSDTWEISDGTAVWTEGSSVFTFTPDFRLDEGMVYTVTIDDSAEDEDGVSFPGLEWQFTTKINSPPLLENGGVNPDPGTTDDQFTFSIVYTDTDDDEATEKILIIDQVEWRMYNGDPTDKTYTDGKVYEFIIELDEGEHEYYFEFSDGKNTVRFPESTNKKLNVKAASDEGGGTGFLDEEYAGVPGMICAPIGLIIIIVIVLVVVMIARKGKMAKRKEDAGLSFQSFEPETSFQTFDDSPMTFQLPGDEPFMSFAPIEEEPAMSFTTFEEAQPSLDAAQPAVVQCPDCGEYLRVRAARRPFEFPCKCGAKLVLK